MTMSKSFKGTDYESALYHLIMKMIWFGYMNEKLEKFF